MRQYVRRTEVGNSLRRLGTDYIDLYQVHHLDPTTDIEETLGALTDLLASGRIRANGSSNFSASEIVEAQWVPERRGPGEMARKRWDIAARDNAVLNASRSQRMQRLRRPTFGIAAPRQRTTMIPQPLGRGPPCRLMSQ